MSTSINCTMEICTETSGAHLVDDIIAVYEDKTVAAKGLRVNQRELPNDAVTNMKRAGYVHVAQVPVGSVDIVRLLTDTLFHDPVNPDDLHSGDVKWIRRYKIDMARFMTEMNPTIASGQVLTIWEEVKDYVIDRETDKPVEFVTIGNRVELRERNLSG